MTRSIPVACGTGAFIQGARLVVDFYINDRTRVGAQFGTHGERTVEPGRPAQPGVRSVPHGGQYLDQALWSILDTDWRQAKAVWGPKVH